MNNMLMREIGLLEDKIFSDGFKYLGFDKKPHGSVEHINREFMKKYHPNEDNFSENYAHALRVGCYSIVIMDYLGIKNSNYRKHFFCASLTHDIGKICVPSILSKKMFSELDMEKVKGHAVATKVFLLTVDHVAASIAEGHHFYQPDGYPKDINTNDPEIEYLRKILGIIDFHDSAATRKNDRIKKTFIEALTFNIPSKRTVKLHLMKAYGLLRLDYSGSLFPHMNVSGAEFIESLYSAGIFGPMNPMNPFKDTIFGNYQAKNKRVG